MILAAIVENAISSALSDEFVDIVNCECVLKAAECHPFAISAWSPTSPCGDGLVCADIDSSRPEAGGNWAKKRTVVDRMSMSTLRTNRLIDSDVDFYVFSFVPKLFITSKCVNSIIIISWYLISSSMSSRTNNC